VQELALGDDRAIERAHGLTDVDSGRAIIPLAEANRRVVGARAGQCSVQ
jgi:hypothetical protein